MGLRDVAKCLGDQRQGAVQGARHSSSTVSSPVHAKYDTAGHSRHRWHPVAKGWRPISLRRTRRRFKLHEPAMDDLGAHPARVHVRLCMCARPTNAHMLPHMRNRAMATRPLRRCHRRDRCRCPVDAILPCASREVGDWLGRPIAVCQDVALEAGAYVWSTQQHDRGTSCTWQKLALGKSWPNGAQKQSRS